MACLSFLRKKHLQLPLRKFSSDPCDGLEFLQKFCNGRILIVGEVDFGPWSFYREVRSRDYLKDADITSTRLAPGGQTSASTLSGIDARRLDEYDFTRMDCVLSTFLRVPDGKDYKEKNKKLVESYVSSAKSILRPGGSIFLVLLVHQKGQFQIKELARRLRMKSFEFPFVWKSFRYYKPRDTDGNLWSPMHKAVIIEFQKRALRRYSVKRRIRKKSLRSKCAKNS